MVWLKGPVCGVDNCRAKKYRELDGRYFCKRGHLRVGAVDLQSEDFNTLQGTKRVALGHTSGAPRTANTVLRGEPQRFIGGRGTNLYLQSVQYTLRVNVEWLIKHKDFPEIYEATVKNLWTVYLASTRLRGLKHRKRGHSSAGSSRAGSRAGSVGPASSQTSEAEWESSDDGMRPSLMKNNLNSTNGVRYQDVLILCYLGCAVLKMPVYLYDFSKWMQSTDNPMPLAYVSQHLPVEMRKRIQASGWALLGKLLNHQMMVNNGHTFDRLYYVASRLHSHGVSIPTVRPEPLILKMIHDFFLPPDIYLAALKLFYLYHAELNMEVGRVTVEFGDHSGFDVVAMLCVIVSTKLCYGLDATKRQVSESEPAAFAFDFEAWSELVRRVYSSQTRNPENFKEQDLMYWSGKKVDKFLAWYQTHLITENATELKTDEIIAKRMFDMFPLTPIKDESFEPFSAHDISEMQRLVTSTVKRRSGKVKSLDSSGINFDPEEYEVEFYPGHMYEAYQLADDVPDVIEKLVVAAAIFLFIGPQRLFQHLYRFEQSCANFLGKDKSKRSKEETS